MGYYTYYSLSVYDNKLEHNVDNEDEHKIAIERKYYNEEELEIDNMDLFDTSHKWYEHDETMIEYSKLYPNLIFMLQGEGEESNDMWIKYYKDGKSQFCRGVVIYDPYDENKLEVL